MVVVELIPRSPLITARSPRRLSIYAVVVVEFVNTAFVEKRFVEVAFVVVPLTTSRFAMFILFA